MNINLSIFLITSFALFIFVIFVIRKAISEFRQKHAITLKLK